MAVDFDVRHILLGTGAPPLDQNLCGSVDLVARHECGRQDLVDLVNVVS